LQIRSIQNKLKCLEEVYSAIESISMEDMVDHLKQREIMMASEEPIKLIDLFSYIDRFLMRKD